MLSSIQKLSSLVKDALDIAKEAAVREKVLAIQNEAFAIQDTNFLLLKENHRLSERVKELETKIAEMEQWERTEAACDLYELAPGVFVYSCKETVSTFNQGPYFCTNRFHKKQKSILQNMGKYTNGTLYRCPRCYTEIMDPSKRGPGGFYQV